MSFEEFERSHSYSRWLIGLWLVVLGVLLGIQISLYLNGSNVNWQIALFLLPAALFGYSPVFKYRRKVKFYESLPLISKLSLVVALASFVFETGDLVRLSTSLFFVVAIYVFAGATITRFMLEPTLMPAVMTELEVTTVHQADDSGESTETPQD